ncbi:alpha/beta fold hydrolase [Pseudoroseicyclus tamaricis]|uniref:Alpha/beta hydrolase n=1 Tax=Pseudoroseicyclus tamaricis TaxID=2705421 RepID=A0A6B2K598_9RHOB|nr:alpha/beta hydrolase [Pseudoroseicyclus tamaricis]NDV01926.1 alpha/beta hydrolase [Pseudoroseicyclus tamaricis]
MKAPFYADVADAPEGVSCHWLTTSDGVQIRVASWRAEGERGTVLMMPGRTEYIEKYGPLVGDLVRMGLSVIVVDWRGQGIAERLLPNRALGHVKRMSDYQLDVAAMIAHADEIGLPRPHYLLGHSMGGGIGFRALEEGRDIAAAAFTAPMWGIKLSAAMRPVAWGLSSLARPFGLSALLAPTQQAKAYVLRVAAEENTLTTHLPSYERLTRQVVAHPDLALGGPSLHWLNESLREMRRIQMAPAPKVPCLTFIGELEAIVDPADIARRVERWPGAELVICPGAKHELLIERPEIRQDILSRLDQHFRPH